MPAAKKIEKIYLQAYGREVDVDSLFEEARKRLVESGLKKSEQKKLEAYLKPEDGMAYFVANGEVEVKIPMF